MLRRLIFVFRMMFMTLFYWGPLTWLKFWLGGANEIQLKGVALSLRKGNYAAKIADLAMAWEVIIDNVYDTYPILPEDIILDIGGHIGSFSTKAAMQATKGKVYTCEPFPLTFEVLQKNASQYENILVKQVAISSKNGSDVMYYSPDNPAENSLVRETKHSMEVPLQTLGSFLEENGIESVDLMKVDCEGAEYDILYDAIDQLDKIKKMVMEVHEPRYFDIADKYSVDGLLAFLNENGFKASFKRENKFQGYIYAHRA